MSVISVGLESGADIEIYRGDHGTGQPVVLIHGFPLNGRCGNAKSEFYWKLVIG